jgi:hypothetical protein
MEVNGGGELLRALLLLLPLSGCIWCFSPDVSVERRGEGSIITIFTTTGRSRRGSTRAGNMSVDRFQLLIKA